MITAAVKHPLPVLPIDGIPPVAIDPSRRAPGTPRLMHPLPVAPQPDTADLMDAIRSAAYDRMMERLGIDTSSALSDPTA